MAERDISAPLTQEALDRLVVDRSDEVRDRAERLGQLVQHNLDITIANPETWSALGITEDNMGIAGTKERRVSSHQTAFLQLDIPPQFQELEGEPEWLNHTEQVLLRVNTYDTDLPEGVDMENADMDIPDLTDATVFYLTPAVEYFQQLGVNPHIATYEDGSRLDPDDTETIIGILALLAEQASAEQSPPPST